MHGNREISQLHTRGWRVRREGKAEGLKPEMDGCEKSHRPMVPRKLQNKGNGPQGKGTADGVEGRGLTKGNTEQRNAHRT